MSDGSYTRIFLGIVALLAFFGFVLPWMISDPSDGSVIGGIGITLVIIYFGGLWAKHIMEKKGP